MAEIYNPWQFSAEEDVTEGGYVSPVYMEQIDTQEDAQEDAVDSQDAGGAEEGNMVEHGDSGDAHKMMMEQALNTINQQSTLIAQFIKMFTKG